MKRKYVSLLFVLLLFSFAANAQQGVHGPRVVSAANTVVNEYTAITAFTPAGSTSITVAASSLNANGRFAASLQPGDLVLFYQAQGAIINGPTAFGNDTTWGRIAPGDYYSTGLYEFRQVVSVPNATTIVIDCGLTNTYIQNGGTARKPMVIRVPRYTTLTINSGGVLTCDDWNGTIGGVLAVEVQGATIINAGGSIDATGKGFRGGSLVGDNATSFGVNTVSSTNNAIGAEKGESIAGYQAEYDPFGGRYGRGAPANGGGGGDGHNAAGGGGANGLNSTSATALWSGNGIPDQTGVGWNSAWNQEPPAGSMTLRTAVNSSGGGRGGYSFSANDLNATTAGGAPGLATWGGDARNHQATGLGGRPLDYNANGIPRLFLGGGGGAGDQNNSGGGVGGDGGGLIYLMCFGSITGTGNVVSNGLNGANGQGGTGVITGIDAGGGGGAGGTVVLNAVGGVANTITINTNGGNGGNQVINFPISTNEAEGPGGGGGGGHIAISSGAPTRNSNGGNNGVTNSAALSEFTPNGATKGCPGTNNALVTNYTITTTPITICVGNSVTLTAVVSGTVPGGTIFSWYSASVGGSPLGTGLTYITGPVGSTTTYWVGGCPGWWRVPVTVTVAAAPVVTAITSISPICSGASATLTAGGAVTYNWMPGNINGSPIIVTPAVTTTYTVTGTIVAGCASTATVTVTVNPTPTVTATALPTTICAGSSTTLTGGGATTYLWNPGAISGSPISVSPITTTTYTVTGTSTGCSSTAQVTVTVNPTPTVTASALPTTICSGNSTTLTGGGASTYVWNPGAISGSPISVSPATTTTYTVTGTAVNGCTSTAQTTVTVNPTPTVTATASLSTICLGGSTTLTGGGATSYLWNPGSISGSPISVSPITTTTYTVTGTSGSCSSTAQVTVTVNPTPTVTASASNPTICAGASSTLTGGGAVTYLWNPGSLSGGSVSVTPATTTTYTVTGTGANGCTSTAQVTVTVNPVPIITASASFPTICLGGSSTLTGGGGVSYVWNPGNISGSPILVSPASTITYTVTGTGANSCTNTALVTVTVIPTPTVTATALPITICAGSSTTLTGGGATTYVWNPGAISGSPISVSPATTTTYTVTGTAGTCSSTAQVTVTVNPTPTVTASVSIPTICAGSSTTLTGGGAVSYVWNPGSISGSPISVSPVTTTTYTVTGTAANGCTSTAQVTVTVNPLPSITATASFPSICVGGSSTLTGGGGLSYVWNPGNISGSPIIVSPVTTTTYTVTGTDVSSCSNTAQITVTVVPNPTVTATASSPTICLGGSTTLTGGGATTYVWNPGNISGSPITVSPIVTTTYTVTGTSGTCSSTAQVTVTVNPTPTVTASASIPTICSGNSSTLTGGGAVSYVWNPGNISGSPISVSPTSTTTYTVTGTGANGCTNTAQVTITVNPTPTVTATAVAPTICSGASSTLSAGGASTYVWNPGNISGSPISVSPVSTTTYTVTGTAVNGCTSTAQVIVTVNPTPTVTATASTTTICVGSSSSLTGGGASTYLWNPGNISGSPISVSPIVSTTYTVVGTAVNGCTNTAQVTVTVNPLPTPIATATPATICVGQTSSLSANGGTTYSWNGGSLVNASGIPQVVNPITTTTYTVDVTDVNGCTASSQVTLTVNPLPIADAGIDQTICSGTIATLNASGGGTYIWNGGSLVNASGSSQSVSPLFTTTYIVTVTNGFSCSLNDTVIINVNTTPSTTAGPDVTICSGDTTQLSASGSGTFVWNPATDLSSGTISNPQSFPASTITYTVTLTAANGCSINDTITVIVNSRPLAVASNDTTICNGSSVNLVSSGGGTYLWNGGSLVNVVGASQSDTPTLTTVYVVTVTATNGCTDVDSVNVVVNPLPTTNAGPDVSICINSSIQLNASGATAYAWSPAIGLDFTNISNPIANPVVTTTYVVTGTTAAGCSFNDTIVVSIGSNLSVFAGADLTICSGDTILLSTSGGVIYNWTPASSLQTPSNSTTNAFPGSTTTYVVNVTDANSCSGSDTVTVFVNPAVSLSVSGTTPICSGQTSTLTANASSGTAPYTYNWSNSLVGAGPQTVSPATTTTYTVSVTDSLGCTSPVQSILVTVNPTPTVTLQSSSDVSCFNGSNGTATVLATGGNPPFTYAWSPTGGTNANATGLTSGAYTVTVTSADGCIQTQSVTLTQPTALQITSTSSPENCSSVDGSASIGLSGGTPGYTYLWSNSSTNDSLVNVSAGSYSVTATDANGCIITTTVTVANLSTAVADAGTSVTITSGQTTVLTGTGGVTYSWSPTTDLSCTNCPNPTASPTVTTIYTLTIVDSNGCIDSDTVTVFVDEACGDIFLPNAFSPNGDLANDTFYVRGSCIEFMDFRIYNRWGEQVFVTANPATGWDGTWRDQPCEAAVFTYFLRATLLDGTLVEKQGTISLVK